MLPYTILSIKIPTNMQIVYESKTMQNERTYHAFVSIMQDLDKGNILS